MSQSPPRFRKPPRFGIWAPYRGHWSTNLNTEKIDAGWALNRDVIVSADRAGFDTVLIAQHTISPVSQEQESLEPWTAAAAAAALTERIEIIAAIKPRLYHPVVLAKLALGIEDISEGRFAINFVNAWFKPELEKSGIGFPEHDDRYAYGGEWLRIVKALLAGERVNFEGKFFQVTDYNLKPVSRHRIRPVIYSGGESEPAQKLAAELSDAWFINGQPLEEVKQRIAEVSRWERKGAPLEFALSGFVAARESDEEAQGFLKSLLEKQGTFDRTEFFKNVDPKAQMFETGKKYPGLIGSNGGVAPGFVGSYDTVARRIAEFYEAGITSFVLSFEPLIEEQERFAREVIPRVRELLKKNPLARELVEA